MVALNWKKLNPEFQLKQILSLLHYSSTLLLQQTSASRKNPKSSQWRQLRSRSSESGFFARLSSLHSPLFPRLGLALFVFSIFIFFSPHAHADQVTLAWEPSSGADGYRLFYRHDGRSYNYSSPAWEGAGTICTIDLDSEATYYLVIRAYNAYGESSDSNEISITIGNPVITPNLDYIEIEGPPNVSENSTADYNCRAYYTDGTSRLVEPDIWDVDCSSAGISATGLLTTYDVDSDRACQITASYTEGVITSADSNDLTIRDSITPPQDNLDYIGIEGPIDVNENSTADYSCRAYYTDGTNRLMEPDTWDVDCSSAGISATGLLTTYEVGADEACQVSANYAEGGISTSATYGITIADLDGTIPPPASDNIASLANVTVSSQTTNDGQHGIKAVDGCIDGWPGDYSCEWATVGEGSGAWISLAWDSAYLVDRVILYDRPNTDDYIQSATLAFDDGTTLAVGPLNNDGKGVEYIISPPKLIRSLQLTIDVVSSRTLNTGLSEIEVFGTLDSGGNIP